MKSHAEFILVIKQVVAEHHGVTVQEIDGDQRGREVSHARRSAFYITRDVLKLEQAEIAAYFNRSQSTIYYALRAVEDQMDRRPEYREGMREIFESLGFDAEEFLPTPSIEADLAFGASRPIVKPTVRTCQRCDSEYVARSELRICGQCRAQVERQAA